MYSAKNIYTADDDSVCDPYATVSFHKQTQKTWTCKKTLCPEWDQTLIFEDIVMHGQSSQCAENPPYVCVSLYDKHRIVSTYTSVGVCAFLFHSGAILFSRRWCLCVYVFLYESVNI